MTSLAALLLTLIATPETGRQAVVVELFTSEGCSSCPPADDALARLVEQQPIPGVEVIGLGFHVDYWDRLGWRDRFSSKAHTRRQRAYSKALKQGAYTPQAVIDGRVGLVGSDGRLRREIEKAARRVHVPVRLEVSVQANALEIVAAATSPGAELFIAVTEDGLESRPDRGENEGRRLRHVAVVRHFVRAGAANGNPIRLEVPLDGAWKRSAIRAVALVSGPNRQVRGAAAARVSGVVVK